MEAQGKSARQEARTMRKSIFPGIAGLALLIGVASLMFTAAASARPAHTAKVTKVTIAMHDPGCHWFVSGPASHRTWSRTRVATGPVALLNLDEATLIVVGQGGTKRVKVGQTVKFVAKGHYRITMVKQMPDDNTLRLTID